MKSEQKYFKRIEDWREWLAKNHTAKEIIWLVYFKKHTGKLSLDYVDSVKEALCYGWIDSLVKRIDDERFMRKFTPRRKGSVWSKYNLERIKQLREEGRMQPAGMESIKGIDLDADGYEGPAKKVNIGEIPCFVFKALEDYPDALISFRQLAPSYKKAYIGWITEAKKEETRYKRLSEMVEKLKKGKTLGIK